MPIDAYRPLISVIIPTYNRCELVRASLHQLTRQRIGVDEFEVIVADDGSSDATEDVVDSFVDRLHVKYHFHEDTGHRPAAARNAGARLATAPILVFLDAGPVPGPDFVARHLALHQQGPRRAILGYAYGYNPEAPMPGIGAALRQMAPEDVVATWGDDPAFFDIRHPEFAKTEFDLGRRVAPWILFWTLNCSMRADDFWAVGGFDEEFEGWGVEDMELGYRLARHGVRLEVSRDAWVVDAPHFRDTDAENEDLKFNVVKMLRKHPDPGIEIGLMIVNDYLFWTWGDDVDALTAWTHTVRDVSVHDEIAQALRHVPAGDRVAVIGAGDSVPSSLAPAVLIDFDRELVGRAAATGRHSGYHALGLRTPLPDQAVDSVIITSRVAGLWDRWRDRLLTEAHRIGRTVHTFDHPRP